ncbi:hypothetical protein QNO07_09375 [Streptomyces sp. 549]|uniref:hypothetical protein n=1 Tax=Streptomyces sp. 549 TaxID=3049076 RepID=UPI0024C361D3|nr:hypothetical protein [Streptomyces sp. 549]MDK1473629.1 hypothetical protein [Streptomyces sp. 549]
MAATDDHTFSTRFRIPKRMWDAYGQVTEQQGTNRTADLVDHVRAYIKDHGDAEALAQLEASERELAERRARKGGRPRRTADPA